MDSNMKEALTFDDKIYGIPRDGYGLGLLLNIKTLGENGLLEEDGKGSYKIYNDDGTPAYPTTFEEIYRIIDIDSDSNEIYSIEQKNDNNNTENTQKDTVQETTQTVPPPAKEETIIQVPTVPKQSLNPNQQTPTPNYTNQVQNEQPAIMSSSPIAKETASTPVITSSVKSSLSMMQQSNKNNQPQIINQTNPQPQQITQQPPTPTVPQPQIINNT